MWVCEFVLTELFTENLIDNKQHNKYDGRNPRHGETISLPQSECSSLASMNQTSLKPRAEKTYLIQVCVLNHCAFKKIPPNVYSQHMQTGLLSISDVYFVPELYQWNFTCKFQSDNNINWVYHYFLKKIKDFHRCPKFFQKWILMRWIISSLQFVICQISWWKAITGSRFSERWTDGQRKGQRSGHRDQKNQSMGHLKETNYQKQSTNL